MNNQRKGCERAQTLTATDFVGKVVDELNNHIDAQDIQIDQLANMVNDLIGKVESQIKEIKLLKSNQEDQRKVINHLTAKLIALEECVEDVQKKVFPKVRVEFEMPPSGCLTPISRLLWLFLMCMLPHHLLVRWWCLWSPVKGPPSRVLLMVLTIVGLFIAKRDPPVLRWYHTGVYGCIQCLIEC